MGDFFPIATTRIDQELLKGKTRFVVVGIPWVMIQPHEQQAKQNHSESLKRLAAQGGLPVYETLNILDGKTWGHNRRQTPAQMQEELHDRVQAFECQLKSGTAHADGIAPRAPAHPDPNNLCGEGSDGG